MGKKILKLNSFSKRIDTINENIKELYKRLDSLDKRTNERVTNNAENIIKLQTLVNYSFKKDENNSK